MAVNYYYSAPVDVRSGTTGVSTGSTIWSMQNDALSTKIIVIENIQVNMSFDSATPGVRSLQRYDFLKFTTATPTGGTSISPAPWDSASPSSEVTDIRYADTGLSVVSVAFDPILFTTGVPATDSTVVSFSTSIPIMLNAGEGLCIQLNDNSVTGQSIIGFVSWSER